MLLMHMDIGGVNCTVDVDFMLCILCCKFTVLADCNWDVNAQDRAAGTPYVSRYYSQLTSRARCLNCNERGHLARDCTLPKVRQCGNFF